MGSLLKYSAAVPDGKLIAGVLAASLGYAVVRYNVFGGVSADQLPVFVTNKAISVGSLVLLGVSRVVIDKPRRKHLGLIGLALLAARLGKAEPTPRITERLAIRRPRD